MDHMELIERAVTAIQQVHSDMSVSQQDTLQSLQSIRDEVDTMIEAVEIDIHGQEKEDIPF